MTRKPVPKRLPKSVTFDKLMQPTVNTMENVPDLTSGGHRPLKMDFEEQLRILVYYHLQEYSSAQQLLQALKEDDFASQHIAPEQGIEKSSFSEAINGRGLEQMLHVFTHLQMQAADLLPNAHPELGSLVGIDGSLIDGTLSMLWADYRKGSKKAKVHVGFDLNHSIPRKVYLTEGNGGERPFVSKILSKDETARDGSRLPMSRAFRPVATRRTVVHLPNQGRHQEKDPFPKPGPGQKPCLFRRQRAAGHRRR